MTFNTETVGAIEETGYSFKPCYKWMTFNTEVEELMVANLRGRF